jgi:flagellin FlaB
MIIFIAMVLVAAVAAAVLVSTAYLVQQQAQSTGHQAIADVATGLWIVEVYGDRTSAATTEIQDLYLKVALEAGSPDLNLSEVRIQVSDGTTVAELKQSTAGVADDDEYDANAIRDPTGRFSDANPLMVQGSLVEIIIAAATANLDIDPQDEVWIRIIPKHGTSTYETFTAPDVFVDQYVELQ